MGGKPRPARVARVLDFSSHVGGSTALAHTIGRWARGSHEEGSAAGGAGGDSTGRPRGCPGREGVAAGEGEGALARGQRCRAGGRHPGGSREADVLWFLRRQGGP